MSIVRVNYVPEFHSGDHVVLVTLDGDRVDEMPAALDEARPRRMNDLRSRKAC